VHEVHTKSSKHDTNKKVMKYTKNTMQKREKYTVYERLEQIAEIHTLISFLFKSTDGTYTIFFLSMINSSTLNFFSQVRFVARAYDYVLM